MKVTCPKCGSANIEIMSHNKINKWTKFYCLTCRTPFKIGTIRG